jgi:hypothetical protein
MGESADVAGPFDDVVERHALSGTPCVADAGGDELFGHGGGESAQEDGVHDGEHRVGPADPEPERHDGCAGEPAVFHESPERVTNVLEEHAILDLS